MVGKTEYDARRKNGWKTPQIILQVPLGHMDFIVNGPKQQEQMLRELGIASVDALFAVIPEELRLPPPDNDDGLSEYEGITMVEELAARNSHHQLDSYLGAGAYEHHIPAIVEAICQKSEFLTAYTPYQAEASQGLLQAIFEFQSAICALTGLDVANASLYDGASACAEAVTMSLRLKKGRRRILVTEGLHPHYRAVVEQYVSDLDVELLVGTDIDESVAAILIQSPNFFGSLEDVALLSQQAKQYGALSILCSNPLTYGLYHSAADLGADIAVGDCQPLGLPMCFGGPYVGYIACQAALVRQLPGRLVGETVDEEGTRGYVLTLQAREQHIRRGKATSNICTNQSLGALACLITIAWYGKQGIAALALTNFQRAAYLCAALQKIEGVQWVNQGAIFNEFTITLPRPTAEVLEKLRDRGIAGGVPLDRFFDGKEYHLLVAVTETKNKEQLDRYAAAMAEVLA